MGHRLAWAACSGPGLALMALAGSRRRDVPVPASPGGVRGRSSRHRAQRADPESGAWPARPRGV